MDIKGFEDYSITLNGEVYSKKRKVFLKQEIAQGGYLRVTLRKNNKSIGCYVNRLMAITYLPNFYNKPLVQHKNKIKNDNRLFNLKWIYESEKYKNKEIYRSNTTGYKNISISRVGKNNYYRITLKRNNKIIINENYNLYLFTLKEVVKIRNDYFRKLNINY